MNLLIREKNYVYMVCTCASVDSLTIESLLLYMDIMSVPSLDEVRLFLIV